jgi:hypothetical protein
MKFNFFVKIAISENSFEERCYKVISTEYFVVT